MRTATALLALYIAAICWPLQSQQRTVIPIDAIQADPLDWEWKPQSPKAACVAGMISVDEQYNLYLCVPDRLYMKPGHRSSLWIRLIPDPTYIPPEYKP